MINELDDVILTCDLPKHGLSAGDIGTVVLVHREHRGYEVEFTSLLFTLTLAMKLNAGTNNRFT